VSRRNAGARAGRRRACRRDAPPYSQKLTLYVKLPDTEAVPAAARFPEPSALYSAPGGRSAAERERGRTVGRSAERCTVGRGARPVLLKSRGRMRFYIIKRKSWQSGLGMKPPVTPAGLTL
jgi:hypothetical protein